MQTRPNYIQLLFGINLGANIILPSVACKRIGKLFSFSSKGQSTLRSCQE